MKVALIADVHANLPALESVLEHAQKYKSEEIWNLGDFTGYGAFPDEVVQRLKQEKARSIIGNYDLKVLQVSKKEEQYRKTKAPEKWQAFKWAYKHLAADSRDYLRSLPQELRFKCQDKRILLVHGSPVSIKEHLTSDTPAKRLKELARQAKADVIACGHSHLPFVRELDEATFINPGSVGRPDDGDPRASYAILELTRKSLQIRHYRVAYDLERAAAALRERGLPERFAQMVLQGRNFDEAAEEGPPGPAPETGKRDRDRLESVDALARTCPGDEGHLRQVTRLSLLLFDQLKPLHGLGARERLWLQAAAGLHDLGLSQGVAKHHKSSFNLIMEAKLDPFREHEKLIIALVARYHRKALPSMKHEHFASLDPDDQAKVSALAAILRVADGLDRSHLDLVRAIACEVSTEAIVIKAAVSGPTELECEAALKKGDLLRQAFQRDLVVKCRRL